MRNPWGGTTDGVMKVKDDGRIPPMIDLRICAPGAAKNYGVGPDLGGYIPIFLFQILKEKHHEETYLYNVVVVLPGFL